ncbi:MAG TPA: DJ-1/PfpI family protein [Candidatus Angelobacter sp.]|nr:DJ-1/PfpI family protein [Candidatus Angelobacter sp.]
MNRRELLKKTAAVGLAAGIPSLVAGKLFAETGAVEAQSAIDKTKPVSNPLTPPAEGSIPVAFPISNHAVIIDFCGPWEVFQDVAIHGRKDPAFHLYTVAETKEPIIASGGMKIIPEYTFQTAPAPKVIVIPAQQANEAMLEWIRTSTKSTDVTMSVCTGAYVLAKTGLLSGKSATTFHMQYEDFAVKFPDIHLKRGARFVEDGNLASSGGLTSGMDLAFRTVERYFGRDVAEQTAFNIEYQGRGWTSPDSNLVYAKQPSVAADKSHCPVCGMDADPTITSVYKGKTYLFCLREHKETFDKAPDRFVGPAQGQ